MVTSTESPQPLHGDSSSNPEEEGVFPYSSLEQTTRRLIEGIPFDELPNEFTLDQRIHSLFASIKETALKNWEERKRATVNPDSFFNQQRKRLREYYLAHPNEPNAEQHIKAASENGEVKIHEFSQKLYLTKGVNVVKGDQHQGHESETNTGRNLDGIDDELAIVDVHTHPITAAFSRQDLILMIKADQNPANKCVFMVAARDINLVGVLASDAIKKPTAELRREFNTESPDQAEYFKELSQLALELPVIIDDPKQLHFVTHFLLLLKKSTAHKVGIYVEVVNKGDKVFKRIQTEEEVIALSKIVSGY